MGGNRKFGFRRGNRAGRNGVGTPKPWDCAGCGKQHGGAVQKTQALDGKFYCEQTYYKAREAMNATRCEK